MRTLATLFAAALLLSPLAAAQTQTFNVTVEPKTADHPYNGQGHPSGYVIDGEQGPVLRLNATVTYTFQMSGVSPVHPFYISTDAAGGGAGVFSDGVTGNNASGDGVLTFTPPLSAEGETLWYQCSNHSFMGYQLEIISAPLSTEEGAPGRVFALDAANPADGASRVTLELAETETVRVEAFDLRGRRVATPHSGALAGQTVHPFALTGVPAGTYVVRASGEGWTETLKVSIAR